MRDLWYGVRLLRKSPGVTAVAVLTLALGIAINTAAFSWIDAVLLRPLPGVADPARLAALEMIGPNCGPPMSYRDYRDFREHLKLVSGLAVSRAMAFTLGEGERAQRVRGELVSGNYFAVLGVKPFLGRFFAPEEQGDKLGAYPVVVISHRLWRRSFGSDGRVLGKTLRLNRRELTVIGVAPPEFGGSAAGLLFDLWAPSPMGPYLNVDDNRILEHRGMRSLQGIARLKPGVTIAQARAEAAALGTRLAAANPNTNVGVGATVLPYSQAHGGPQNALRAPLGLLMAMCGVVLLIVCANVANLLLARAIARRKEFSIRVALGAGRARLIRQVLTETLLLAAAAALAGVPLAAWLSQAFMYLLPATGQATRLDSLELNLDVLGFTMLIAAAAALLAGVAPAFEALRSDIGENLKESGRSGASGARSHRLRNLFVVSEVALALVALVGAGLFLRSFRLARAIHPGFENRNVLVAQFYLTSSGYSFEQFSQFCQRLRERLEAAPGVAGASFAELVPLGFASAGPGHKLEIEGYVPRRGEGMTIDRNLVSPGFLPLLKIPIVEGRDFTGHDDEKSAPVMIVNQSFARRFYGGASPIGRKVRNWGKTFTVVGVARDSKYYRLSETPLPYFYAPFRQLYAVGHSGSLSIAVYIRTAGEAAAALPTLRRVVAEIDPNAGAFEAMPLAEYNTLSLFPQKLAASLLSVLGALALLLAGVGLYSVMAYAVAQRTQEIGVRMALGAGRREVLAMVFGRAMRLTMVGIAAGAAVALAAARLVAGMLLNVSPADPAIFLGAALFLALVALLASYLPARRATRVDPMVALRCQ